MKIPDLYALRLQEPKNLIQFAAGQLQGSKARQEDYFLNFNDECFVVADGVESLPHGDVAAKLAAETAVWAYKLVRQRRYYWTEKMKLLARMFRSTNMTLWQKQKEWGFTDGMGTTLTVLLAGPKNFWIGHVGDSALFLFRDGTLTKRTIDNVDRQGVLTKVIGGTRYGLKPQIENDIFTPGDVLLLVTKGITNAFSAESIRSILATMVVENVTPVDTVAKLLKKAEATGVGENMTVCLIRRMKA